MLQLVQTPQAIIQVSELTRPSAHSERSINRVEKIYDAFTVEDLAQKL